LKDDLHVAAKAAHFPMVCRAEVVTLEVDTAGRRLNQTQHQPAQGALARTRFANQTKSFAGLDIQRDIVDSPKFTFRAATKNGFSKREDFGEIANFEQGHEGMVAEAAGVASDLANGRTSPS
jgi:hypothetical protein